MPLPECNYCGAEYDPYDRHTCAGNDIWPRRKRKDDFSPVDLPVDGLTRQQIGDQLDLDRAVSSAGESALDELSALDMQAGGDHYRDMKIQPIEYIIANEIGFLPGNIIKYASRYKAKGGAEDIRKVIHYCKLILEFEYGERNGG